jgi:outer membrane protein assembly factor BamB
MPDNSIPATAAPRKRRLWPAWAIIALAAVAAGYLQVFGIVDNGTSNGVTIIVAFVALILLGVWIALFAPFSRLVRWWSVAAGLCVLFLLTRAVRLEGFTGNLVPMLTWRWARSPEAELAARGLPAGSEARLTASQTAVAELHPNDHDYPGFLGANRDAYVPNVKLDPDWRARPPKLVWKQPIGGGYSAFAIVGDLAFTQEQRGEQELASCYEVPTGKLIWYQAITARHHDMVGGDGPGSTPMFDDGRIYTLGGTGVLRCFDAATGKMHWTHDVLADVGTDAVADHGPVPWGRSASPLIVDDLCVVPGGGPPASPKISLLAYNKTTGDIVWKAGKREVSYSSPSLATYGGVRQIVIVNEASITGHDPKTGELLWEAPWEGSSGSSASASQSVQVANDRLFVSKGYSMGGGALFEIKHEDDNWTTKKLWHNHRVLMTKFSNVIVKDGAVYGLSDGVLQCVDLASGKPKWIGADYGHGQVMRVGELLLVVGEDGTVALVNLDPTAFLEHSRMQAIEGKTWNNPALSGNRLLVRNSEEAACYELPLAK